MTVRLIGASVFIATCSLRNRLRRRLARLRDPRYLIGAVAGVAYLTFMFTRVGAGRRRRQGAPASDAWAASGLVATAPALAGLPCLAMAAAAWLVPFDSGLLEFSKAETHLLFPAPAPRWQLLVHRLIRSQAPLILSAILPALLMPLASPFARTRFAIGMWLILVTGKLYFTGVAMARARWRSPDPVARWAARAPGLVIVTAALVVAVPIITDLTASPPADLEEGVTRAGSMASNGLPALALWPVTALTVVLFASSPRELAAVLPGALAVAAVVFGWALAGAGAFEEATEAPALVRGATLPGRIRNQRVSAAWSLGPAGRPEGALVWKGATETARIFDWRLIAILAVFAALAYASGQPEVTRSVGLLAVMGASFTVLIAPQTYRADVRQDLEYLDLLKTWPVRGASMVRGAMIWPTVALTLLAWLLTLVAFTVADTVFPSMSGATRAVACVVALALAPGLIGLQYAIHGGTALAFPAWVQIGRRRPRGLDVAGQRMVTMAATWVVMSVAVLPGAAVGGVVWLALSPFVGAAAWGVAAAACSAVLVAEALVATEVLGPLFDQLDLTGIERPET